MNRAPVHPADLAAVVGRAGAGHRGRHRLPPRRSDQLLRRRETEMALNTEYTQYGVQGMVDFFRLVVSLIFLKFLIVLVPYFIPYFLKIFKSSLVS